MVSIAQRIDRDSGLTSIDKVTLTVTDAGDNVASTTLSFTILDINDNSPEFTSDVMYVDLEENTSTGQLN